MHVLEFRHDDCYQAPSATIVLGEEGVILRRFVAPCRNPSPQGVLNLPNPEKWKFNSTMFQELHQVRPGCDIPIGISDFRPSLAAALA